MTKRWVMLLLLLLLCVRTGSSQTARTHITTGSTVPTNCTVGDVFYQTNSTAGLYQCTATDTWAVVSTGGTVTSVTTTSPLTGGPITGSGTVACATCVTSASSLTSNAVMIGGGSQASATITGDSTTTHLLHGGAPPSFGAMVNGDIPTTLTPQVARLGLGAASDASYVLKMSGSYYSALVADGNSGTAQTIDWSTGNEHASTLTGNVTYTFSNPVSGGRYVLLISTGSGSFTATWPAAVKWPGSTAPTITTAASKVDLVTFIYDGTNYYGSFNQNY